MLQKEWVRVGLLIAFMLLIHLPNIDGLLGSDESGQLGISQQSYSTITSHFASGQNHPLYGVFSHWAMEHIPLARVRAFRLPALFAGLSLPIAFYFWHRRWAGVEASLFVAVLLTTVDPLRTYTTIGRGYSLLVLGVLVLNQLVLAHQRNGRLFYLALYVVVGTATCYSQLWGVVALLSHATYLIVDAIQRRERWRTVLPMLIAIFAAAALTLLLYAPMLQGIRDMLGQTRTRSMLLDLLVALSELFRFGNWTIAVCVVVVPMLIEAALRGTIRLQNDPVIRLHSTLLAVHVAVALIAQPNNFGSRFLLGMMPSFAALGVRLLSQLWESSSPGSVEGPYRPISWLAGLGLGTLMANRPNAHQIPPSAGVTDHGGSYTYFDRELPALIGDNVAIGLVIAAVSAIVLRRYLPKLPMRWRVLRNQVAVLLLTLVLSLSLLPLILGKAYFAAAWFYELHTLAIGTTVLFGWHFRFDPIALRSLRYAFLLGLVALTLRLGGGTTMQFDSQYFLTMTSLVPLVLIGVSLAKPATR